MPNRTRKRTNNNQSLVVLVGVLAVILIGVICLSAILGGPSQETNPDIDESTPESSAPAQTHSGGLTITSSLEKEMIVMADEIVLEGHCDPNQSLQINGVEVPRQQDGSFTYPVRLLLGSNEITVTYQNESQVYHIERRYVMEFTKPMGAQSYSSGATVYFEVSARAGSQVSVNFNGKTIALSEDKFQLGTNTAEGFLLYTGTYKLTNTNLSDVDMGVITYTATCDGITETYTSGKITCLRPADVLASDPSVTPDYGKYIDVGSGYIVEIISHTAETFFGATVDDYSRPVNNYLPEGTVDYCSTQTVKLGSLSYAVLRSGQRVYVELRNNPTAAKIQIVDRYRGKLPDHNEIGFVSMEQVGRHTIMTLDCLWKAPFYFDMKPQTYKSPVNGSNRNYSVTDFTAEYIDITFCYATVFSGEVKIPADNPLFKSAELIRRESDCTLRLYLKKTGGFYGWDSYYNDDGQLCFQFLNPAKVTAADNALGVDLTGVKVVIDVGHGGSDPGTIGKLSNGQSVYESGRNLILAQEVRKILEAAGAEVVMNRTTDIRVTLDERVKILRQEKPDYCLNIHHNSIDGHPEFGGVEVFYFTPFSKPAADFVLDRAMETGFYSRNRFDWHTYYMLKPAVCPIVLSENGYLSCTSDLEMILDPECTAVRAQALAQGIADYFLSINE